MLFQRSRAVFNLSLGEVFFDPPVFIKNLIIVFFFINVIEMKNLIGARQTPAIRIKGEVFEISGELFDRLSSDKAAGLYPFCCFVIKFTVCF